MGSLSKKSRNKTLVCHLGPTWQMTVKRIIMREWHDKKRLMKNGTWAGKWLFNMLSIIIWKKYIFEHQSIQSYQLLRMRSRGFNGACLVVLFSPKSLQRTEHLECGSTLISVEFHGRKSFKRVVALVKQRSSYHKQWWWPGHWTAWRPRFPPHKCSWPCRSA